MSDASLQMEAYSYRVSARFGSRVQVSVADGQVTVTGPRVGLAVYRVWILIQAVLLVLVFAGLALAAVLWHWAYLVAAVGALLAHLAWSPERRHRCWPPLPLRRS